MLMEMECIEPVLFLEQAPGSYERFAAGLRSVMEGTA
jgi:hypothetical protein